MHTRGRALADLPVYHFLLFTTYMYLQTVNKRLKFTNCLTVKELHVARANINIYAVLPHLTNPSVGSSLSPSLECVVPLCILVKLKSTKNSLLQRKK